MQPNQQQQALCHGGKRFIRDQMCLEVIISLPRRLAHEQPDRFDDWP